MSVRDDYPALARVAEQGDGFDDDALENAAARALDEIDSLRHTPRTTSARVDFPLGRHTPPLDLGVSRGTWADMCDEIDRLRVFRSAALVELRDIRSQWGDDVVWLKHHEKAVERLLWGTP